VTDDKPAATARKVTLAISHGRGKPATVSLDKAVIKLGSSEQSDVPLHKDAAISRNHAIIENGAGGVAIVSLGSVVKVNGKEVNKATLHTGDVIELGETKLTVTIE
jgi:hypothetical protein